MIRLILLLFLLLVPAFVQAQYGPFVLLTLSGGTAGVETWCTNNSANCLCSEPMDSASDTAITDAYDFTDSPDSDECWGNRTGTQAFGNSGSNKTTVDVSTDPDWGDIDRALEFPSGTGALWMRPPNPVTGALSIDANTRTYCMRFVQEVTNPYSGSCTSIGTNNGADCQVEMGCTYFAGDDAHKCRNKVFETNFSYGGGDGGMQVTQIDDAEPFVEGDHSIWAVSVGVGPAAGNGYLGSYTYLDCDDKPCTHELCIDGNLSTGQNIQYRYRVTSQELGTAGTIVYPATPFNWDGGPSKPDFWGGDMFHSGPTGTSKISHFIVAKWDADNDNWIGPPCELTSSC